MRRHAGEALMFLGVLLIEGGKLLAGLGVCVAPVVGIVGAVKGNATWLLLVFPGAPVAVGLVNVAISLPGVVLLSLGSRLKGQRELAYGEGGG